MNYADSPPWTAWGNFINTWSAPMDLLDGDALQIGATGYTRIDFWGANKSVSGEGPAPAGWPLPGEPSYALIGRVTSGRVWVPGRGSYRANTWFPVGAGTPCLEYDAQVLHARFECGPARAAAVGQAGTPLVEEDQPERACEPLVEVTPVRRLPPVDEVRDEAGDEDEVDVPSPDHLVGDRHVAVPRVADVRLHGRKA